MTPYQEVWAFLFVKEANILQELLRDEIVKLHHIGSTSIKGMKAKPVIDILAVTKAIDRIDLYNSSILTAGYVPKGENGIPGRRYFQKGGDSRTHHLHVYEADNPEIERHLAFRDYLREHPAEAAKYGDLKEELATQFPFDIASYIKGKEALVLEMERKALRWYRRDN